MSEYFDEEGKPILFGPDFSSRPQPGYQELRTRCPVARTSVFDQVVIARHEDVVRALRQPEIFSSRVDLQLALGTGWLFSAFGRLVSLLTDGASLRAIFYLLVELALACAALAPALGFISS